MQQLTVPQWDQVPGKLSWKEKVAYLAYQLSLLKQGEAPVEHIFAPGVYIREMTIPKGMLFVGRGHRYGHCCQLVSGSIIWITPIVEVQMDAPVQVNTEPGYQMVLYTLTEVRARTLHPNVAECRDTAGMENDIFEPAGPVIEHGKRIHDYRQMFVERGVDEEALRPLFESNEDIVPFDKDYAVEVSPSDIHGWGVRATLDFPRDSLIAPAKVDGKRTMVGRYTNHSFTPNARFKGLRQDLDLISLRDIKRGEEITVDYRALYDRSLAA